MELSKYIPEKIYRTHGCHGRTSQNSRLENGLMETGGKRAKNVDNVDKLVNKSVLSKKNEVLKCGKRGELSTGGVHEF